MRAKVDSQVAALAEMKDAQLAPSEAIAHQRVRMEGWRQRLPGSNEKTSDKKKKNRLDTFRPSYGRTWLYYWTSNPLSSYSRNRNLLTE
jgi:hypothetical protein